MAAPLLTAEQLARVYAKLERANENIRNLNAEITAFLKDNPASVFGEDKENALDEWVKFHAERGIPPRFGVLAGEIVHHLRSSLDHIAWLLSSESYRRTNETAIAFPIFIVRPTAPNEVSNYKRKVQGITSVDALKLIENVQPYNAQNPIDDPLAIVHELDRVDKHHTIVLVVGTFDMSIKIPTNISTTAVFGAALHMDQESFADYFAKKVELKMSRQVAFANFGQRKNQTIIPALTELENAVKDVVKMFGG